MHLMSPLTLSTAPLSLLASRALLSEHPPPDFMLAICRLLACNDFCSHEANKLEMWIRGRLTCLTSAAVALGEYLTSHSGMAVDWIDHGTHQ